MEQKREIVSSIISGLNAEISSMNDLWKTLETKTQGTIACSGILLAGLFTLLKDMQGITQIERVFLVFSVVMLIVSLTLALRSLLVVSTASPPHGLWRKTRLLPLLSLNSEADLKERVLRHMRAEIPEVEKCLESIGQKYKEKTGYLLISQKFLFASIGLVCGSAIIKILNFP